MIEWDSELYLRYEQERTQPSLDLARSIPLIAPQEIIDLGCGPGNSTRVLRNRWPNARITGLDSSLGMLERARQSSTDIEWRAGDDASPGSRGVLALSELNLALIMADFAPTSESLHGSISNRQSG